MSLLMAGSAAALSGQGRIAGCDLFPADNVWNVRIDHLPVHPQSAAFVSSIGPTVGFHADFGSGVWPPGSESPVGIPYTTVVASQPGVPVLFFWDGESDPGPYPIPPDAAIEGGSDGGGDRHVLVLDSDACILYELFDAWPPGTLTHAWCFDDNAWCAWSGVVFDLASHALRPDGWTSADAAGLPILPGLVRREEVVSGEVRHALRFTATTTRRAHVWPARHDAGSTDDPSVPAMGQRFRLRADFDTSDFSPEVQVLLRAMQRYGIILADNGSNWFISGAPHPDWDNGVLRELRQVVGGDFEAVDATPLMISPDSGQTLQGGGGGGGGGGDDPSPPPPSGVWLSSPSLPGFRAQVLINGTLLGAAESRCIVETLCVSGALAGRPEVFIKVIGPRPNGFLWTQVSRFTPSRLEIWLRQQQTGKLNYYLLGAAGPDDEVSGLQDREAFTP